MTSLSRSLLHHRVICSEDRFVAERILTCSWKAGSSDVGAASRSNVGTPRTRCQPSSRRSQGEQNTGHKAGVGPEGGRGGLEESYSSTPRKHTGWKDVADVVADVASTPCKRDATPIDSCVVNVARLLVRVGVGRGWFSRERWRKRERERKKKVKRELHSRVNVWLRILILHLALNTDDDNVEHVGLTRDKIQCSHATLNEHREYASVYLSWTTSRDLIAMLL